MADQDPTPTAPCSVQRDVQHELRHVRTLMQLEQKEDQAQFKLKNAIASIKERISKISQSELSEHNAAFEEIHNLLQQALSNLDGI